MDPKVTQNSSHVVGVLKVSELAEIYLVGLLASGEHDDKAPVNIVKKAYSYAGAMVGMRNELLRNAQEQDNALAGGETTREEALATAEIAPDADEGSDGEVEISEADVAPVTEPAPPPAVDVTPEAPTTAPVSGAGDQTTEFSSAPKSLDDLRGNR